MVVLVALASIHVPEELAEVSIVGLVIKPQSSNVIQVRREFTMVALSCNETLPLKCEFHDPRASMDMSLTWRH
jgi:hypothetical protein